MVGRGQSPVELVGGMIRCTGCKKFMLIEDFKLRLNRGKRIRSRWCNQCVRNYQHEYYNKCHAVSAQTRDRRKLSAAEIRGIAKDRRKGLAVAIDYNISLSTVYKIRSRYGRALDD